jgi:hypothetical protein
MINYNFDCSIEMKLFNKTAVCMDDTKKEFSVCSLEMIFK